MDLKEKIKNKKANIAVIGLGYVGLPLAAGFADSGFNVLGLDNNKEKVKKINKGKSYISDVKSKDIKKLVKNNKLKATTNKEILKKSDIIIICLPTPLDKYQQPDVSLLKKATKTIKKYLHKKQLIVLESTTYPGTTKEVILPILKQSKLNIGKDFFLAFSPERVDPGNKKYKTKDVPKVVGGITKKGTKLACSLYNAFVKETVPVSSPKTAEMTKLLENTFRIVNISMIDEIALMCDKMGIDVWEVIKAAKTKPYGFMPFYPGPGIGGHCISIDPFYLSWKAKEHKFYARFIDLAGQINAQMPHFVVTKIIYALNKHKKSVNGSNILIWGIAYKKDISDTRESPAYPVIKDLIKKGANIKYFDPFVKEFRVNNTKIEKVSNKNLNQYDCIVILTDHSKFDYEKLPKKSKLIVDTRNAIKKRKYKNVFHL